MRSFSRLIFSLLIVASSFSSAASEVQFLAFGDFGTGGESQKRVAAAMETFCSRSRCDFVVGLGDNFYPSGVQSTSDPLWKSHFETVYGKLGLVFHAALGNHDYAGNPEAQVAYTKVSNLWYMPAKYFSFKKGNAEFFALDTNETKAVEDAADISDAQLEWLEDGLKNSSATWKIVYGHAPIFSYGLHGNSKTLQKKVLPLLEEYEVDAYLAGHDHDKQLIREKGKTLLHLVSGAVSQTRPVGKGERSLFASNKLGFTQVSLTDDTLTFKITDEKGKVEFTHSAEKRAGVSIRKLRGPAALQQQQEEDRRQETIEAFGALAQ